MATAPKPPDVESNKMSFPPVNYEVRYNDYQDYGGGYHEDFDNIYVRNNFISRVFSILGVQLLFTFICIFVVSMFPDTRLWMAQNFWGCYVCFAVFSIAYIILVCVEKAGRSFPCNIILLMMVTVSLTGVACFFTSVGPPWLIVAAVGILAGFILFLSMITCCTSFDITKWMTIILILSILVVCFGLAVFCLSFFIYIRVLYIVYLGVMLFMFSLYFLVDLKMVIGGGHVELSPDDYILGVVLLYTDIIYLFIIIYELLSFGLYE